ncbi:MAG: OsmC family protein [Longimicrobiales bacterium]
MSMHSATVSWQNGEHGFGYEEYTRDHTWEFANGRAIEASAAPAFLGDEQRVDPEEAFVAALASCHMLTFLAIASRARLPVRSYRDQADGELSAEGGGGLTMQRVTLRPRVHFDVEVPQSRIEEMHRLAHQNCFLARSVKSEILIEAAQAE